MSKLLEPFTAMGGQVMNNVLMWAGYGFALIAVLVIIIIVYYYMSYNYKVLVIETYGGGKQRFAPTKFTNNYVKWKDKERTSMQKLFPLFNNKTLPPISQEHIYPGGRIIVVETQNGNWLPVKLSYQSIEGVLEKSLIEPVPVHLIQWQNMQHRKLAMEYADQDFWSENRSYITAIITVLVCCILTGVTMYYSYQFLSDRFGADATTIANALQNFGATIGNQQAPK